MSGKTVTVAENRIVIGSEKLPLISGEFHYWRNAKSNWSQILQTCKSMGFRILSTYVAWSYHELEPGPSISPPILACRARADALPCVLSPATHTKETPPGRRSGFYAVGNHTGKHPLKNKNHVAIFIRDGRLLPGSTKIMVFKKHCSFIATFQFVPRCFAIKKSQ